MFDVMGFVKIGLLVVSIPAFFFVKNKLHLKKSDPIEQVVAQELDVLIKEETGITVDVNALVPDDVNS